MFAIRTLTTRLLPIQRFNGSIVITVTTMTRSSVFRADFAEVIQLETLTKESKDLGAQEG